MNEKEKAAIIEGILFLHEEPLPAKKLAEITETPEEEISLFLENMMESMEKEKRGLQIMKIGGGYLMGTNPFYASYFDKLFVKETKGALSRAALETLAIIAYKQPITRIEIEEIRGVRIEKILENLLKRQLIKIVGRKDGLGRPLLYGTTANFLKYFGLNNLHDLPPLEEGLS